MEDINIEVEAKEGRVSHACRHLPKLAALLASTGCAFYFQLMKLTVPILKQCVERLGIRGCGTRKAELMSAIAAHFGV